MFSFNSVCACPSTSPHKANPTSPVIVIISRMSINVMYMGTMWCEIKHLSQESSMPPKYDHANNDFCPESSI